MSNLSIQDQHLEVTVVSCINLTRTAWMGKQNPYVCLEYGSQKCRTRVCTGGDKNPNFNEKFPFKLIEGIREIKVTIRNKNFLGQCYFIASGRIQLTRVIKEGCDESTWTLLSKSGRSAGELKVILHYENAESNTYNPEEKSTPSLSPPRVCPPPLIHRPLPPVHQTLPAIAYQPPPPAIAYQPPPPQPVPCIYPSTSSSSTVLPQDNYPKEYFKPSAPMEPI